MATVPHNPNDGTPFSNTQMFLDAFSALGDGLIVLSANDRVVCSKVRQLAKAMLVATEEGITDKGTDEGATTVAADDYNTTAEQDKQPSVTDLANNLWPSLESPSKQPSAESVSMPRQRSVTHEHTDLPTVVKRCRLKAEGARWVVTRQRRTASGADFQNDIARRDGELIARAKELPNCYLWMNDGRYSVANDLNVMDELACCFDTFADAVALVHTSLDSLGKNSAIIKQSLHLLAEAQSALHVAVVQADRPCDDDQRSIYAWLKEYTNEERVHINRHMRSDDPAEPSKSDDLRCRIQTLDTTLQNLRSRDKQRRKLLGKIRYAAKRIMSGTPDAAEHRKTLIRAIDELISNGMPASSSEIRETLLPIADMLPDMSEVPANVRLVFREVDRYLANITKVKNCSDEPTPSAEVMEVRKLLEGKSVVLIGGVRRPHALDALEKSLGLEKLIWNGTKEHEPITGFKHHIARKDVAVVLLAVRWSSHSFGGVKGYCDRYGKLLVRLPGGYSPNQVAAQILQQCGVRLRNS